MLECTLVYDEAISGPAFHVLGKGMLDFEVARADEQVKGIRKGGASGVNIHSIIIYLFKFGIFGGFLRRSNGHRVRGAKIKRMIRFV